jgi:AhpD family alkylhydroperoxidase
MTTHTDRGFTDLTPDTAPAAARTMLEGTKKAFGFVPSAMARMALTPLLPRTFQAALSAFEQTSLTAVEREVIVLTMARTLGCDVCLALHARMLTAHGGAVFVPKLLEGTPLGEERLDALVAMTLSTLERRGDVSSEVWARFLAAGFTRAQALELVLGLGAYTFSIYANRLTAAPVDDAFV